LSTDLDKARDLVAAGEDEKALEALKRVEIHLHALMAGRTLCRDNDDEAKGLMELASAIRDREIRGDATIRRGAGDLAVVAQSYLDEIAHQRLLSRALRGAKTLAVAVRDSSPGAHRPYGPDEAAKLEARVRQWLAQQERDARTVDELARARKATEDFNESPRRAPDDPDDRYPGD
jgi:hypothetical protein